jgi:hypothetical protein
MMRMRARPAFPIFLILAFATASLAQRPATVTPPSTLPGTTLPPNQSPAPIPDPLSTHPKVRTAWLSDVRGEVALARYTGGVLQKAFPNSPVPEQGLVQTGVGRAEIDFLGGNSIRLAPYSAVEFPGIDLLPSGTTASTVRVLKGTVYISLMPSYLVNTKGSEIHVAFGEHSLRLLPSSHVRIEIDAAKARLVLFDGPGQIDTVSGPVKLPSNRTVVFDPASPQPTEIRKIEHRPMDNWDRIEMEHQRRSSDWENRITRHYNQAATPSREAH